MMILAIDTSCDDTSVSVLQDDRVLAHKVSSQIRSQREWGGVVPMLAKRRHSERIELVILNALRQAGLLETKKVDFARLVSEKNVEVKIEDSHKIGLKKNQKSYLESAENRLGELDLARLISMENPGIDLIAVTAGPGLAPALEIGLKAAGRLSQAWGVNVALVNHMEGHMWSGLLKNSRGKNSGLEVGGLPGQRTLGILVSGGHTEMVFAEKGVGEYKIVGQTLDDAAGEAFDKFAVALGLGYPGGAVVENFAKKGRTIASLDQIREEYPLPIPMKGNNSKGNELNFSFSGLKTAAIYMLREKGGLNDPYNMKADQAQNTIAMPAEEIYKFCASFQHSVVASISDRVERAVEKHRPELLLAGGGVVANLTLRRALLKIARANGIECVLPEKRYLMDNASMIGLVGYYSSILGKDIYTPEQIKSDPAILDRRPGLEINESIKS